MNEIEYGILLNFIVWIVALPTVVFFAVWVCVMFFAAIKGDQENIVLRSGRVTTLYPSPASTEAEERYRKSA